MAISLGIYTQHFQTNPGTIELGAPCRGFAFHLASQVLQELLGVFPQIWVELWIHHWLCD